MARSRAPPLGGADIQHPSEERPRFTEISLPMPRRMNQRHVHLFRRRLRTCSPSIEGYQGEPNFTHAPRPFEQRHQSRTEGGAVTGRSPLSSGEPEHRIGSGMTEVDPAMQSSAWPNQLRKFRVGEAMFIPSGEVGLRVDRGDAETGAELELEASMRYVAGRLDIEGRVRRSVLHRDADSTRKNHRFPAADADPCAVTGRTPARRFDVVSTTPSASLGPCGQYMRKNLRFFR